VHQFYLQLKTQTAVPF